MDFSVANIVKIGVFGELSQLNIVYFIVGLILCGVSGYLSGSFNFALIISRWIKKDDIRKYGSGNAGMTNMLRTYGKGAALGTLLGDAGKAALAALLGILICGDIGKYVAGLFCIIGHVFPLYFKFKGGKGVVTSYVMMLFLNPLVFLIVFIFFVAVVAITKYLSLGSIMAMLVYPLLLYRMTPGGLDIIRLSVALFISLFVIFLHRTNIGRLLNRTESKFTLKTKGSKNEKKSEEPTTTDNTEGGK